MNASVGCATGCRVRLKGTIGEQPANRHQKTQQKTVTDGKAQRPAGDGPGAEVKTMAEERTMARAIQMKISV